MNRIGTFFQNLAHYVIFPAVVLAIISAIDFLRWWWVWTTPSEFFARWSTWTLAFSLIYFGIDICVAERKMQKPQR